MKVSRTSLEGVLIIEPRVFSDRRGFFLETFHQERYQEAGIAPCFVQDNLSFSVHGTLRGLHFQHPRSQAKLVQVLDGEVFDVAVDIRRGSPSFGKWAGVRLSSQDQRQLLVPEGFAHGFCVLSRTALVAYKCSDLYAPECEGGVLWCDPELAIEWPSSDPLLSEKDSNYPCLRDIPAERLPRFGARIPSAAGRKG